MVDIPRDNKSLDYMATVIEDGLVREVYNKYVGRRMEDLEGARGYINTEIMRALAQIMDFFGVQGNPPRAHVVFNRNMHHVEVDIIDPSSGDLIRPYQWAIKLLKGYYG